MNCDSVLLAQGGLGNQLLQLAASISISDSFGVNLGVSDILLSSRIRALRGVQKRHLSFLLASYRTYKAMPLSVYYARFIRRLGLSSVLEYPHSMSRISLRGISYFIGDGLHPALFDKTLDGFWHSINSSLDQSFGVPSVSGGLIAHVRRGDFLSAKVFKYSSLYPLPSSYYTNALTFFGQNTSCNASYQVISDDIPFVLREPSLDSFGSFTCNASSSPERDLWLLTHSSKLILANSTLSAVGAHLASLRNPNVAVVAPRNWFATNSLNKTRFDLRKTCWNLI